MNAELNNLLLQLLNYKSISNNLEECKKCINFCIKYFTEQNLNISIEGSGRVITQDYLEGEQVPEGTAIRVTMKQTLTDAH